jgi:hypothetical protein
VSDWGTFKKVEETKDYYMLVFSVNKNMLQIFPKRAFTSPEQEAAFRDLLKRHVGVWKR